MPTDKPMSKVYLSEAQAEAEAKAIKKSKLSASDFRRAALKFYVQKLGIEWPDDMTEHGGKRLKKPHKLGQLPD